MPLLRRGARGHDADLAPGAVINSFDRSQPVTATPWSIPVCTSSASANEPLDEFLEDRRRIIVKGHGSS
jgi:hypothetical protein